ncbi:LysR family transcriptional regulator [Levilactobacillus brevis]
MDQVQAMRIFTRIVELGSFSRAAERLQLPRATVSNALKRPVLRADLHDAAFHRCGLIVFGDIIAGDQVDDDVGAFTVWWRLLVRATKSSLR